jgi:hypothetical protein
MSDQTLRRLDAISITLLLLWIGMGVGFGALTAPWLFQALAPNRDVPGMIAGGIVARLDWAAWIAFGGAGALSWGSRWLNGIEDAHGIGPLHLWSFAAIAALLMCFASSFLFTPRLQEIRAQMKSPIESLPKEDPIRRAYDKSHSLSRQFFFLRLLLAAGLTAGISRLPREAPPKVDA